MLKKGLLILSLVLIFFALVGIYYSVVDNNSRSDNSNETVDVVELDIKLKSVDRIDFSHIDIPVLPFDDNPDPEQCGIPQLWQSNSVAYLNGRYMGDLIQPIVYLYDSHGRNTIVAAAKHGTEVEIVMYQANPVLNYYFVKIPDGPAGAREGWVPAPFLSFDPVEVGEV